MDKTKPNTSYSWLGNTKNIYAQEDIVYSPFLYGAKRIGIFEIKPKEEIRLISYPSQYFFIIVNNGTLRFKQNDLEIDIKEGEALFRDASINSVWVSADNEKVDCMYFLLTGSNISFFYSEYERRSNLIIKITESIDKIVKQIINEAKEETLNKRAFSILLYSLFLEIINPFEVQTVNITQKAIDYIEREYQNDNLSVQDLANYLHISYHYFCHLFKQENLISPQKYIAKYRLNRALQLLKTSNLAIEDIFINVGFKNKQSFIKECKEETGLLPSDYRKKNRPISLKAKQTKKITFTNVSNIGDPCIIVEDKKYYMFTTARNGGNLNCYVSDDMKYYNFVGEAIDKNKSFGKIDFWAPEVIKYNNEFYLFYSARDKEGTIHINVAKSSIITGPYIDLNQNRPLLNLDKDTTDGYPFIDKDGRTYLFFVLNCTTNVIKNKHISQICVVEIEKDFSSTKGDIHILLTPSEKWELKSPNNYFRNESPGVVYKDGTYFLTYSANNHRDINYCSGLAKSKNILGPYIKNKEPIAKRIEGVISSPGHISYFYDLKGNFKCAYHILSNIKQNTSDRRVCISSVYIENNELIIDYK